ncbi:hypothetical protein GJ744_010300 [Endocarpon pusillum]|uniref:Non-specific serine/threonine protein kinase n=1 Tax=Endocarpon pusillum TaxID=364733 RepID=A0A8H7AEH4_9EURO|nr:hypothetical protein GJ744_010300 [Endocarpon pusillum]
MERSIDIYTARLSDPNLDAKTKANIATELRDSIETLCSGSSYPRFLAKLWPVFKRILLGEPVFMANSPDHILRNHVLEILHRVHTNSPEIETYAADMVDTLMDLVRIENEDNAVLCMKTIMDLERHQVMATASKVQPFLELIQEMFQLMEKVVKDTFDTPQGATPSIPVTPSHASQNFQSPRPASPATTVSDSGAEKKDQALAPGMQSFKVLAECPIIVVSIFQAHRNSVSPNVKKFVPLIKEILLLQAKPQERAHAEKGAAKTIFTGVCKEIKNRAAFGEFITAQVKTMSFLAYLLRVYAQQLQDFLPTLPSVVVRLLKDCPREKSSARKELLVAIRHIINFNYRKIFLQKIDELLEERTLIGDGLTVYEGMRPLAYSMLADLIHHVRDSLNRDQIRKTIEVYTRNLHDNFPGTSFQTMSAKLLLNMAESITKLESKQDARYFLMMILDAIGDKFAAMNHQYNNAVKLTQQYAKSPTDSQSESFLADKEHPPDWDEIDIFNATPIKTSNPRDRGADPVADNKFLFKNLVNGLKNMFYQLKMTNPQGVNFDPANTPVNWPEVSFGYNAEEVHVFTKLFHEGARVFRYYKTEQPPSEGHYSSPVEFLASHYVAQMSREEKELLESFGTVFHCIDTATFHEVFHAEIPHLHDLMSEHTALLHLPQFFLASEATSPAFAGMVLQYLMERIHEVGSSDVIKSSILLRMFKLSFMAVTLFSQQNEQVLHPHVTKIVTQCVQLSVTAEEPMNYFLLLRSLFRSIGGGRFELLYKEILPLLEMLLETFNNLLQGARKPAERDLYVELTLTVPARLSHLLPHLSHLMRPLVVALRAGSELVGQGLRTLELCVDNLTADYLDPIMAPIMDELMTALWDHLKPNPYSHFHAHTTMRILGKLGGRNRKFLNHAPQLTFNNSADDDPSIDIKLVGSNKDRAFPINTGIDLAIAKLHEVPKLPAAKASDSFHKQQSFRLLSSQLKLNIGLDNLPDELVTLLRMQANDLIANKTDSLIDIVDIMGRSDREQSMQKKRDQEVVLKKLLKACIYACTVPELEPLATAFLHDVCRHLTLIELGRALTQARHRNKPFDVNSGEGESFLDPRVLADAFVECLASDDVHVRETTEEAIKVVRDTTRTIFGSMERASKFSFFHHLAKVFCHHCHEMEWFAKAGGALGIHVLATELDLGDEWLAGKQIDFVRALMFVIKDMPPDLPAGTRRRAQDTLEIILRRCNKGSTRENLANEKGKLYTLCGFFVFELAHMNRHVRETAQHAFAVLAEVIGVESYDLIEPVKDRLLLPIFNKPLRALPFATQIGFIDAITFCLGLGHDLVTFHHEPLNRLMMESLALVDAEDETLHTKPAEHSVAETIVDLRVACLRLLSLAMNFAEFASNAQQSSRARIIAVFFKSLYHKSPEIIDAANAGLKDVLTQTNKLPKDLLQNGLRPILMNLQDPKRLSVQGLDGLARLLTLLTNYFKVEIGARLLEHMKVIADDATLQKVSFGLIEQNSQMKIVAAIFNIFHLLPPAATTFMEELVNTALNLEEKLRRTAHSPLRKPLVKYLNRYPKETWSFFQTRMQDEKYGRFFGQILSDPEAEPLRLGLVAETESFIHASFDMSEPEQQNTAAINAIFAAHSVCSHPPTDDWLQSHPGLKDRLLSAGKELEQKLRADQLLPKQRLRVEQAGDQLMDIFARCLALGPSDLDFLFKVLTAAATKEIKVTLALYRYLYQHVISSDSVEYRRSIVGRCLDLYTQRNVPQRVKTFVFHYVVNPILAMDIMRTWKIGHSSSTLMDKSMAELLHNRLWKPQMADNLEDSGQQGVDHSRMEILQLTAMLLKYHASTVAEARKDIIRFAWIHIRLEDIINKYGAYVLISYFIASYESPQKVAVQIYVSLLRAHQNEGKALVTQALEILTPVLPQRVTQAGDPKYPLWARWPRRILAEETGNLQQMISIFNFLVRQADFFYESREHFVPIIVPSLHKIASPPNPSNESKKLVLSLIDLISIWEEKRVNMMTTSQATSSLPSMTRDTTGSSALAPPSTKERPEYVIPLELRTAVIKYLVTFITSLQEKYPVPAAEMKLNAMPKAQQPGMSNDMCVKAMKLLRELLSPRLWADVDIDLYPKVMEPILAGEKAEKPDEKHITSIVNALQVLRVIIATKKEEWIVAHLPAIRKLLEKPLRMENLEIQDCLHAEDDDKVSLRIKPLLRQVLDAIPQEQPEEEDAMDIDSTPNEFVPYLSSIATETLSASNLTSSISILWTLSRVRPAEMDQHIPNVMRALQQSLAKDHVNAYSPPQQTPQGYRPGEPNMEPYEFALGVDLIKKTIDLLSARMSHLGDQRRPFLSVLASLVEKSYNAELCNKVLDMVEKWIFDSEESWPTLKEKHAVLLKMLLFENRPDQSLLKRFLQLVIRIYDDPKITRTELTVRLEHAFLIGTRAADVELRNRFMAIFDRSLSRTASSRLSYVLTLQNWDTLAESFWLRQATQLIMGSIDTTTPARLHNEDFRVQPVSALFSTSLISKEQKKDDVMVDDGLDAIVADQRRFNQEIGDVKVRDVLEPLCQLQHVDADLAYDIWVKLFPLCWAALSREERMDLEKGMVTLLTREYHQRQLNLRPNVIQALLEGAARCKPRFKVPPHVMKFLSRTYSAWYTAMVSLEDSAIDPIIDTPAVRESNLDALVEIYAGLQEDDLFYGTWRRRCKFVETNAALSYEQHGIWDKAQQLYEAAQVKARTGVVPFSQGEYSLWEDHWMICAQKMQQWEILSEFAKHENFNDLLLEAAWRNFEAWQGEGNREQLETMIKAVSDAPTPRRTFFQAFMSLLKFHANKETRGEFNHMCDEAIQLSIRKWHQLPKRITNAHIPILQNFQQLVELHDASLICDSLQQTTDRNLDQKSQELKMLLLSWRDRLPNIWDDINAWQDLVTWRQHVFQLINSTYLQLAPQGPGNNVSNNSFAFRGFHETAWIINRFAHVARKHQMPDVCIYQLSKIYTLPNIEIQEAFLKLREQAKCHYQNKSELNNGLDVINNTNLNFFGPQQKAEFYTLKGMFLAKLAQRDEADDAFGTALYYDLRLPKAWAEWGQYCDRRFKEDPSDMQAAFNAVSCYLEAAGLYKSSKARKLLSRILWLLSLDNEEGKIASALEIFKGDTPVWYWITFIPQLLSSLEHREARLSRSILSKIAKLYPQALFFQLRTTREELLSKKKQAEQRQAIKAGQAAQQGKSASPERGGDATATSRPGTAQGESAANGNAGSPKLKQEANGQAQTNGEGERAPREPLKKPEEYADEIMAGLKTAFPLLALSMETMTDQIQKNFKCPPDEDAYRLIVALLNDGLAYIGRAPQSYAQDVKLPPATEANICRFAETILPGHLRKSFEADFVNRKPTMFEYIQKLRKWRDKFEEKLDRRQPWISLETYSPHLSEFRFLKFDEVEVPGQYLEHRDKNTDFTRIERFMPAVDVVRGIGVCHRRLTIRGHDGSLHPFAVQHPAARHCRREERILQLFRIFNGVLAKRKESRRRNLYFHLPLMVPIAPHIRLVQDDSSYISLQGVYEDHCRKTGTSKDEPILFTMEKLRALADNKQNRSVEQMQILRTEILTAIQERWVPNTIVLTSFQKLYTSFEDFWLFRRQFSYQFAATTFMTYIMHISNRYPSKLSISRSSGNLWASELIPTLNSTKPFFYNPEQVHFRLTPNIQTLMGPLAMEGIFAAALMAIARCLTEPSEQELEQQLSIFVRDEMIHWAANNNRVGTLKEEQLREAVGQNSDAIVRRALGLARTPDQTAGQTTAAAGGGGGSVGGTGVISSLPASQTVIDMISKSVNPIHLASMDALWMPYL